MKWFKRKQKERVEAAHVPPQPKELVVPQPPAPPTTVHVLHRGSPAFSKARRERNKAKRLRKLSHGFGQKLSHGRQHR